MTIISCERKLGLLTPIIMASILISASAATASSPSPGGAVSGGGGGTLPANPVSTHEIERIVKNGFREMRLVAREISRRQFRAYEPDLYRKLFRGPKTIIDVLEETGYELRIDRACQDSAGNEVDASIFAAKPGDICISAFRIAPKVIEERARIETLALVFHELSHKLGTDEDEATEFQKDVAYLLSKGDPDSLNMPVSRMFYDYAGMVERNLQNFADRMEQGASPVVLKDLAKNLAQQFADFSTALRPTIPYSYYDRRQFEYIEWLETRLEIIRYTLYARYDAMPDYWEKQLDDIFGGSSVMTYGSYLRSMPGFHGNDFENNILSRPRSDGEIIAELRSLKRAFELESNFLFQFGSALALHKHASDNPNINRSPFAMFLGKYKLIDVTCTSNGYTNPENRIPLEMEFAMSPSGNVSEVEVKKSWRSMWSTDVLMENGTTTMGGSVIYIDGSDSLGARFADAKAVYGTPWGERHDITHVRVEERATGLHYVETYHRDERAWRGPLSVSYSCEAKLK